MKTFHIREVTIVFEQLSDPKNIDIKSSEYVTSFQTLVKRYALAYIMSKLMCNFT